MISFSCRLARERFVLDADFAIPGGCVALFGASGSGKTTIAKLIAGLDKPDRGRIVVDGRVLVDTAERIDVPVHKRRVGLVFQDGQLLPHLSVRQNLGYGRYFSRAAAPDVSFDSVVDLLGIGHLLEAPPATLSGGERQRVAIGRALLAAPKVLVMDEPLASLDAERKLEILPFIERLRDELALPIVYVSHAVEEVARLATVVVRLAAGHVLAIGRPGDVFASALPDEETDRFEAVSFLSGAAIRELPEFGVTILDHPAGEIVLAGRYGASQKAVRIAVPATNVTLAVERPSGLSVRTALKGRIIKIVAGEGPSALANVELTGGDHISAYLTRLAIADLGLVEGSEVYALVKSVSIDERAAAILGSRPGR